MRNGALSFDRVEVNFILKEEWGFDGFVISDSSLTLPSIIKNKKTIKEKDLLIFEELWRNFYKKDVYKYSKNPIKYLFRVTRNI